MHPVISQAAMDPSQLPILASFVKEFRDLIQGDQRQLIVQSTISYHRLLYHQLASFLGLQSQPLEKGSARIVVSKPPDYDRNVPAVQMRLMELARILDSNSALKRAGSLNSGVYSLAAQQAGLIGGMSMAGGNWLGMPPSPAEVSTRAPIPSLRPHALARTDS